MKLGLTFNSDGSEAHIVDLDHNDRPNLFTLCLNTDGRNFSDYPREDVIAVARDIAKKYNALKELGL